MPLVPQAVTRSRALKVEHEEEESFRVRLPKRNVVSLLDKYCMFVGGSRSYVIEHALRYLFRQDREFAQLARQGTDAFLPFLADRDRE